MGCCISTSGPKNPNLRPSPPVSGKIAAAGDRDPPQPEEETLKEVLSAETPIPKPLPLPPPLAVLEHPKPEAPQPRDEQRIEEAKFEATTVAASTRSAPGIARSEEVSEISQVSDLNSVSESVETASAARDEEVESSNSRDCSAAVAVHRRSVGGPAPKLVGRERQRRPRSPDTAKKTASSPEKRNRGAEKQSGSVGTATVGSRRRSPSPGGYRCDPSSGAVRRSRSPATRTEGGAVRVKNMSPRAKTDGESVASAAPTSAVSEEKSDAGEKLGGTEQRDFSLTNESLENPSVSLECFIFL